MVVNDQRLTDGSLWCREVFDASGAPVARFAYLDGATWERTLYVEGVPVVDVCASPDDYPNPVAEVVAAIGAATDLDELKAVFAAYVNGGA